MAVYTLPDMPYDYGALEPAMSGEILELHHSKHHAAYVKGSNDALDQLAEARDRGDYGTLVGLEKTLALNPDYVDRLWNLVNWTDVTSRFDAARASRPRI